MHLNNKNSLVGILSDSDLNQSLIRAQSYADRVDIFELRIDCLLEINLSAIAAFQSEIKKPLIFTLRPIEQGGKFAKNEENRIELLMQLAALNPQYIDIEYTVPQRVTHTLHQQYPSIQIIRSFHDFSETSAQLELQFEKLIDPACQIIKLITTANSAIDCLRLFTFMQSVTRNYPNQRFVMHCMGELGSPSRILGGALGNIFTYAFLSDTVHSPITPGLIDIDSLRNIYHVHQLNHQTRFFGLLGTPVSQSIGHLFHNHEFIKRKINAVYVKFKVEPKELEQFIEISKSLPFSGFSVTMPLKKDIIPLLDHIELTDQSVNAINTIKIRHGQCYGKNTDGIGAIDALEKKIGLSIAGYNILLLGAGGAAHAIAFAAASKGSKIWIVNRTEAKAQQLSALVNKNSQSDLVKVYDEKIHLSNLDENMIIVNALPAEVELPKINLNSLTKYKKCYLFDINYYQPHSTLVDIAKTHAWKIIDGVAMFNEQAHAQQSFWALETYDY